MKNVVVKSLAFAVLSATNYVYAGGPTGGALEVTQWFNRGTMLSQLEQQVQQAATLASQYSTQLQQYQTQIKAGLNIANVVPGLNLDGLVKEIQNVSQYKKAIDAVAGDVNSLSTTWKSRLIEAQLGNMTLDQYAKYQGDLIAQKNQRAISRIENEQRMFSSVQEDYSLANEYASRISSTSGIHESMGLMNTQMNRLIQQNARMVALAAQAQGSDKAQAENQKAVDDAALKARMDDFANKNSDARDKLRSRLQSIGTN